MNTKKTFALVGVFLMMAVTCFGCVDTSDAASGYSLYGAGANQFGQLGNGDDPAAVTSFTRIGNFTHISAVAVSDRTTFFIDNGRLFGAGANQFGQQGQDVMVQNVTKFTRIGDFSNVTSVSVSGNTTFFIDSGKLYGMGDNQFGQQGNGTTDNVMTPTQIGDFSNVTSVSVSDSTTFFIDSDKLYGMGKNEYGNQGQDPVLVPTVTEPTEILVPTESTHPDSRKVTKVIANDFTTFFTTGAGELFGAGYNAYGQQGDGSYNNVTQFRKVATSVRSFATSGMTTFYIADVPSTLFFGTGLNASGQMGNGNTNNLKQPTNIKDIWEEFQNLAVSDNTTLAWGQRFSHSGQNTHGQQGVGNTNNLINVKNEVIDVLRGTVSNDTTLVIYDEGGKLYVAGSNMFGQLGLGDGQLGDVTTFTEVPGLSNVRNVYASTVTSFATMPSNITTHTVTIQSSDEENGTVDVTKIYDVLHGTPITVDGNTITINGTVKTIGDQVVTATPTTSNVQYSYAFDGWSVENNATVNSDLTITATFTRTTLEYGVAIRTDGPGTVNPITLENVPYGTSITASENTVTINGTTVTATPLDNTDEYTYAFDHWTVNDGEITSDSTTTDATTITAHFSQTKNVYDVYVLTSNSNWGDVNPTIVNDVPFGTVMHVSGNVVTIGDAAEYGTVTATPVNDTIGWHYAFDHWDANEGDTTAKNTKIKAIFTKTAIEYTVTFEANGGVLTGDAQLIGTAESPIILPTVTKEGEYFQGWYTGQTDGDKIGMAGAKYTPTAEKTLYAHWSTEPPATQDYNKILKILPILITIFLGIGILMAVINRYHARY